MLHDKLGTTYSRLLRCKFKSGPSLLATILNDAQRVVDGLMGVV